MDSSINCCPFVTKLCAVTKLGDLTVPTRLKKINMYIARSL